MDDRFPLERLETWLRGHPFAVDAGIAALVGLFTVVLPAGAYWPDQGPASLFGLLLTVPLAWRRRHPVRVAAVVVAVGLLELVVVADFLFANVAALVMVYTLAAYAPRWASRAGLALGLLGAALAALRYYADDSVVITAGSIGVAVVAAWALGDLRRARVRQVESLEERARLLELERDQEMRLAADDRALAELTPREREVLELMAFDATNTEIAQRLYVSEATVKTHVGRVLAKTGSRDRVQAVVLAYRTGLVSPADLLRDA